MLNPQLDVADDVLTEKPTLICLHGGPGGDHQSLRPHFDRFQSAAQVVYLDQRGGGRSAHGDAADWTLDQWADDVATLCDTLGVAHPILLGVSGGSLVAQSFLARHPDRARGVILANGCARMDRDALVQGFADQGGPEAGAAALAMYSRGAPEDVPAFFRYCLPLYSRRDEPLPVNPRTTFNLAVSQHFFGPGGEAFRFDHRHRLKAVGCPVLILSGAYDPVTRPEWGKEVADALPEGRGEFVLLANSSHMIMADEPEAFYGAVDRFIERASHNR